MEQTPPPAAGDCFSAAGKFVRQRGVLDFPEDYRLVHGKLAHLPQDVTFNHAWVEEGEFVHDTSNGQYNLMERDRYYASLSVTNVRKYTPEEAVILMIQQGHWGPWE